jgi:TatD DNase family protein
MEKITNIVSEKRKYKEAGVDAVICVGGDFKTNLFTLELNQQFPDFFYPAIGVHPSNIFNVDLDTCIEFISNNISNCVALGEVGLDYSYNFARSKNVRSRMTDLFKKLLEIVVDIGLPASVHSRSAYRDTFEIVADSGVDAVFHWYDGPVHILNEIIESGFYISASPSIQYSKGVRAVMLVTPLERILVETDSPVFLKDLGRESTPIDVVRVVEYLAKLKELEFSEVAKVTTRNAERLFGV